MEVFYTQMDWIYCFSDSFVEACWNLTAERTASCWSPAWTKPARQNQERRWTVEGTTGVGVVIACWWLSFSHLSCLPTVGRTKPNVGLPQSATMGSCSTECSAVNGWQIPIHRDGSFVTWSQLLSVTFF